jgi:hypothetical protein
VCYYSFWVSAPRNLAGLLQRVKVKSDLVVLLLSVTLAPVDIVQLVSVCWNHYLKACPRPVLNCAIWATKLQERNREWDFVTLLQHCLFTTYTLEQISKCLFLIVNNSLQSQVLPHTSKSQCQIPSPCGTYYSFWLKQLHSWASLNMRFSPTVTLDLSICSFLVFFSSCLSLKHHERCFSTTSIKTNIYIKCIKRN